jgi:hypothetical protein
MSAWSATWPILASAPMVAPRSLTSMLFSPLRWVMSTRRFGLGNAAFGEIDQRGAAGEQHGAGQGGAWRAASTEAARR